MHYLVLLHDTEDAASVPGTPEWDAEVAEYAAFGEEAGDHIAGGEALQPSKQGLVVRHVDGAPVVTEGAFAETAEVVGGYYVLEADDLDVALDVARKLPALRTGAVEVRPMVGWWRPGATPAAGSTRWLALLHGAPTEADRPGSPSWEAAEAAHAVFEREHDRHLISGAALQPPDTATTLRRRDGELVVSDGPFAETAEVVGGYYELWAADREEAVRIAERIPVGAGAVELRPIVEWDT
ncbi:YciI family protein [Egicoccus sp. AB-alg2]|uniref:YciI family protein n=1 Tax=Egicoccus sp. AB-alg2 TaxID=3242693 RepID=UPI00359CC31E